LYHLINICLHMVSVILLYRLLTHLGLKTLKAFILAAFFAIHPVLTQAVAWIPGRNDTLLGIFVLAFFNNSILFVESGEKKRLFWSALFLLLALFTKETGAFAPLALLVILAMFLEVSMKEKRMMAQYGVWVGAVAVWFVARRFATTQNPEYMHGFATEFLHRLPLLVQYYGKIILPFNLSVFPTQEDTTYYLGILAILFTVVVFYFSPQREMKRVWGGLLLFVIFLIPALIVPSSLNNQTFEHRLYLPILGVLLMIPETVLLNGKYTEGQVLIYSIVVIAITAGKTLTHQQDFSDPHEFWTQAVETSPNSAFANMHLSEYEDNLDKKCGLIRKAFRLDPKEKYVNFFYAEMLINSNNRDSLLMSEPYLRTEQGISNFYKCNFYLARIAVERGDTNGAIQYLQEFLKTEPENSKEGSEANNNLLVLYVTSNQTSKIVYQARHMKELGLPVPDNILQQYHL
jgi:protein O-mannosyl-transferase